MVAARDVDAPLHALSYDADGLDEVTPATLRDIADAPRARRVTWINVNTTEDPGILRDLEQAFGIHPLAVEDVKNTEQRPKVEEYPGYLYVVTRIPTRSADGELTSEQVSLFLSDEWIITVQERPGDVFEGVRSRIRAGRPRVRGNGPDYLMYALLDAVVDAYFPILETLGTDAEELEDHVLEESSEELRLKLQDMRRQLLALRRIVWPQRDALHALERGDYPAITAETRTFLRDVSDHASRVIDFVETNRELASNLMDLYLAGLSHRTNEVMRTLTMVATVFIPLTFIAGVYGMNFETMPELGHPYGYPVVWTVMILVAIAMLVGFRHRGWL